MIKRNGPKGLPVGTDRAGWAVYYARLFNRTQREQAAHMAMWYILLMLADEQIVPLSLMVIHPAPPMESDVSEHELTLS